MNPLDRRRIEEPLDLGIRALNALLTCGRGQRLGMICFGSRVELFVPPETEIGVAVGEHVKAGVTIMGVLP